MTRQTSQPMTHRNLSVSNRSAREVARLTEYGLDLNPPYQRGSVWTEDQRINLIRSWLTGVPVPPITINDRLSSPTWKEGDPLYAVIDGKQRTETAIDWFTGKLAVPASWFPAEEVESTVETDDGPYVTYNGLTVIGQRYMANRAMLPVIEVKVKGVAEEAALYVLLEQSGTKQTEDDVARAEKVAQSG